MDRFGDEEILDVVARVKAGQGHPGDVEALTELSQAIRADHPALAGMIDDALKETDWIAEAEKAGNVPTMRPPTAGGFGGVPPNMGPMTDGRFDYLPTAAEEAQNQQGATERLQQLREQQNTPPPPPGPSPLDAVGSALGGMFGGDFGIGGQPASASPVSIGPATTPPPSAGLGNPLEALGGLLGGDFGMGAAPTPTATPAASGPSVLDRFGSLFGGDFGLGGGPDTTARDAAAAAVAEKVAQGAPPAPGEGGSFQGVALPPDRGGQRDRRIERGDTNWKAERDARRSDRSMRGVDTLSLGSDSAFAGVEDVPGLLGQTDLMARMIAEKMGGGPMTAAMIAPQVQQALALVHAGQIGGGSKESGIGSQLSNTDTLQAVEDFVRSSSQATGTEVDPYAAYSQGFKRALHTDEAQLQDVGDDDPSTSNKLAAQVKHTQASLLAGAGGMTEGSYKKLQSRLDKAANDWLLIAMKSKPGEYVTYPEYLRGIGAKDWFR